MDAAAAHLLNFSQPFDCSLLDQIVLIAMDGSHPQRGAANEFLVRMKDHPDMWKRADAILEVSKQAATKFFGLQVLSEAINTHWKVIPQDQREGIRSYVVSKILSLSSSDALMRQNNTFLPKLNLVLVQILKQDWPHNWPTFISDIVSSSKTSESLCENNMRVLKLLSEEIFDFSRDSMTAAKIKTMKESLNEEFLQIFQLCEFILGASAKESLLSCTLQTLQRFLSWIPLGYIFETNLVPVLISKFLPQDAFRYLLFYSARYAFILTYTSLCVRTSTIDCLTEIASLPPADIPPGYRPSMQLMLVNLIQTLSTTVPRDANVRSIYETGSEELCLFVQRLALFLSTYLKSYLPIFDQPDGSIAEEPVVQEALLYMIRVTEVEDEEVFKTCLEFWSHYAKELYTADVQFKVATESPGMNMFGAPQQPLRPRHTTFSNILHSLRILMIDRMAKPEEVIIVEDDNGEIVREQTKDTEVIAQYKTMRETIVYLTNLNYEDTEAIMLEKLDAQVAGGMFTWNGLNTLCWAIGSISGAMGELDEKRFLVSVIKDLLRLCEEQRGKDNKAVVASNIMYIVGQYPRFLRAHWKFLKTVVNKLFEFMHEHHPGVQDMACDTFIKIAQKCKRKFMTPQVEDPQPFILTLINDLQRHVADLQPHQVQSFYESVATMLSDQGPAILLSREEAMLALMNSQNTVWQMHMSRGGQNFQALLELETVKDLQKILRINTRVCIAAGAVYIHQLSRIFLDVLNIYHLYSDTIIKACAEQGPVATRLTLYKAMRGVKSEILELFQSFLTVCQEQPNGGQVFMANFMPSMMPEVLNDYRNSPPAARDPKVLTLFATAVVQLKELISPEVPKIMDALFEKTLEMITTNMLDFPEHRIGFFQFLHEANQHCFYGLFSIPSHHQKLVVDSIVWAFKHTERNISETGLDILYELLVNVSSNPTIAQPFYVSFMLPLIQDVFAVLTDRLHKSGFKQQASILKHLFHLTKAGQVTAPLHSMGNGIDNVHFLREHIAGLLIKAFPNLTKANVANFVEGLFDVTMDLIQFKQHLRDFLIAIKEFESEDNSDLFIEETEAQQAATREEQWQYMASVPGLLKPAELNDDPDL